jgi:phage baseplate assembly protein W
MPEERVFSDLDIDFTMHPITKDVSRKTKEYAIIQSVKNLIMTNYYERPFNPSLGSGIRAMLFEPIDGITASTLNKEISNLIDNFEPRVKLDGLQVNANDQEQRYDISIRFYTLNSVKPIKVNLFLNRLR